MPGAPESSRRAPDPSFPHCGAHAPVAILRSSTGTLRAAVESHVAVEALRRVHRAVGAGRDIRARSAVAHVAPGRYAPDYMMGSGPGSTWDGASARRIRGTVSVRRRSAIRDTGLASSFPDSGASIGRRPGRLRAAWRMHRLRSCVHATRWRALCQHHSARTWGHLCVESETFSLYSG